MDDETFKKEVLDRLQQIIETLTSILPEACIEEPEGTTATADRGVRNRADEAYSMLEEMQDNYQFAVEKWQREHGA
ncbi:hypothetical protein E4633_10330 [Geomonas terrae]|uniref:Uncharacterized protein n=1 Tax=Geomonas terrae TaxID=2562681 RepID=A0A4S1CHU4_9BACT|nr:hypothetical protein [Geomonas terrae]TGU72686.1 hypothetical protein E4633_10330 [Geomonas terrae]